MRLAYVAFDRAGKQVTDVIDAASTQDAREQLRKQGLFVTEMDESSETAGPAAGPRKSLLPPGKNKRLRHVASFTRQLHVLVLSGTPLVQALIALQRQATDAEWHDVIATIRTRVEEGCSLSAAMQEHPRYFDGVCRSLIAAGESSGKLEPMLDRLAKLTRKTLQIRNSIRGAMVYPILLMGVAVTVLVVLLTFVLPRFASMFEMLGAELPPTTKFVMALSDILTGYWWALLIVVVGGTVGAVMWLRSDSGRLAYDTVVLQVPLFGTIVKNFATARIARLLGVQLEGRVPLLEALHLTRQASGNIIFANLVQQAEEAAERGQLISTTFANSNLMPATICEAMRSGEATGQMATLLLSIADFLDEENDVTVRSLTSVLEPIILIIMGICVGFVAVSMFLPMFDLTSMASQGGG